MYEFKIDGHEPSLLPEGNERLIVSIVVFLSSVTGEGFDEWLKFLRGKVREKR